MQVYRALAFFPSSTSNISSDGTPRTVEEMGATVTVERWPMAASRGRMRAGRCLSGDANRQRWTSPRFSFLAKPRTPPRDDTLLCAAAELGSYAGRAPQDEPCAGAAGVPEEPGELARIDSPFAVSRPNLRSCDEFSGKNGCLAEVSPWLSIKHF